MKTNFAAMILTSLLSTSVLAAEVEAQTCEQIREQIETQKGVLPKVNTRLLQTLSLRQDCHFSAVEVYRAAYGDKPLPIQTALAPSMRNRDFD